MNPILIVAAGLSFYGLCIEGSIAQLNIRANSDATSYGKLIFEDRFERNESQEQTDEPGNGWGTNSKSRAKGNKQVDLQDGSLRIYIHAEADHAVSVTHPIEFVDGTVALRFKLENPKDNLGINFADLDCKEVHAGHLFVARVGLKESILQDLKTGTMRLDIRQSRTDKEELTQEQKDALVGKQSKLKHQIEPNQWHELVITVAGDQLTLVIDGETIGKLNSPGISHPTKKLLRLSVPNQAIVDDIRVWRAK